MAGTIVADTLTHSTAGSIATNYVVEGSLKQWVNFNGTGTIAIRDSLNTSSLTDLDVGQYSSNFSNSFSGVNYYASGTSSNQVANSGVEIVTGVLTNYVTQNVKNFSNNTRSDVNTVTMACAGDLA